MRKTFSVVWHLMIESGAYLNIHVLRNQFLLKYIVLMVCKNSEINMCLQLLSVICH